VQVKFINVFGFWLLAMFFRGMCFASAELVQCSLDSSNSFGIYFSSVEICFTKRSANSVAHEYARYACTNGVSPMFDNSHGFLLHSLFG
jgi:hypothetical protein